MQSKRGIDKLVEKLAHAGRVTREEGRDIFLDFRSSFERNRGEIEDRLEQSYRNVVCALQLPTRAQVDRLHESLKALEERIKALEEQ